MEIPKHYSLHSENDSHFVVHDDRDGNTFNVAKKGIHPANQIKIMKMQKLWEGTTDPNGVQNEVSSAPPQDNSVSAPYDPSINDRAPQSVPSANSVEIPQASTQTQPTQQQPQQIGGLSVPSKSSNEVAQFQANQGLEESGLKSQGAAQAKAGELNAKTYEDANKKINDFYQASNAPIEKLSQENDSLAKEIAGNKVDPNQYYHNLTTGGKISNAIAVMLGGIGAGAGHTQNMALQTINGAIARDIESQKMNLGKKESLLSTNLARYKDMRIAQIATATQMNAMAQGQIAANTARYGGLAAQGANQAALGQLKNQNLQGMTALKQAVFDNQLKQHLASGNVANDNPLDYVQWVVPPDKQKEVSTELGKSQFASQNHEKLMSLWDRAQKEQTMMRTGMGLVDAPATRELRLLGDPLIHEADGRVNEFEKKDFEGTMPSSGQSDARQKELRDGFENFIMGKQNAPLAKTYGIDVDKFNATKMNARGQDVERAFTSGPHKGKIGIFDSNKNFKGFK